MTRDDLRNEAIYTVQFIQGYPSRVNATKKRGRIDYLIHTRVVGNSPVLVTNLINSFIGLISVIPLGIIETVRLRHEVLRIFHGFRDNLVLFC